MADENKSVLDALAEFVQRLTTADAMGSGAIAGAIVGGLPGALLGAGAGWAIVRLAARNGNGN
jgi:hypothetical protein